MNAKNKTLEFMEEVVNVMRDKGMMYSTIAREFGVSRPKSANQRQN